MHNALSAQDSLAASLKSPPSSSNGSTHGRAGLRTSSSSSIVPPAAEIGPRPAAQMLLLPGAQVLPGHQAGSGGAVQGGTVDQDPGEGNSTCLVLQRPPWCHP